MIFGGPFRPVRLLSCSRGGIQENFTQPWFANTAYVVACENAGGDSFSAVFAEFDTGPSTASHLNRVARHEASRTARSADSANGPV